MDVLSVQLIGRKREGAGYTDGSDNLEGFAAGLHQISPFLKRSLM
jgi:hypothetical protein